MRVIKLGIKGKILAAFIVMGALLSAAIGYAAYTLNSRQVEQQYSTLARSCAGMAAGMIDGDSIEHYLAHGADAGYADTYERLALLKTSYGLKYLYVAVPNTQINDAVYIFDIGTEHDDLALIAELGDHTGELDVYEIVLETYLTGEIQKSTVITNSEYGYLASAYVPLYASNGRIAAVIGADIPMDIIINEVRTNTVRILSIAVVIIVIFLLILLLAANRQILMPIHALSRHMESFVSSDNELTEIITLRTGDELESMADSFNRMVGDIRRYIDNLAAVTADRERIAAELNVATQIQTGMLPSIFPPFPERTEFDIFASMLPAKEVGGDFYDFFMLDGNRLCLVTADVSGKGVPAALFMVITKTLIKNQAAITKDPGEILSAVNNQLCETNDAGFFVTAFVGILALDTGHFSYANAGHCRPLVCRSGKGYEWLNVDPGFVLAGLNDYVFTAHAIALAPGDSLFLYTDGVTEAQNAQEELWGEERLAAALNSDGVPSLRPAALTEHVIAQLNTFVDGAEQADDITILAMTLDRFS